MFILIKDGINYKNIIDIDDNEIYENIYILKENDFYYVLLKNDLVFEDGEKKKKLENKKYIINTKEEFNNIELYVYENNLGFNEYKLYKKDKFLIANHNKANIYNLDTYLNKYYLYFDGNKIETNYDSLLVNNRKYNGQDIKEDDEVRFHNIKIIFFKDYLYMNSFLINALIDEANIKERVITYEKKALIIGNTYQENKKELVINSLKEFDGFMIKNERKLIFQIGPSITMSLAMMAVALINILNNKEINVLSIALYILMPLTMLLSGVLWPTLTYKNENKKTDDLNKRKKNEYINYLDNYYKNIESNIKLYIDEENYYFFDGRIENKKLFSLTEKSNRFLDISLGKITINKGLVIKETGDNEIDNKLMAIKKLAGNISNHPLYLNVLNNNVISIVSRKNNKLNIEKKYLLELASKYDYDDFYLGIYSENIDVFYDVFGIPQLIYNNKRLTLNKNSELQEINNYKFNKPLILLITNRIEYDFSNKDIHILYFSESMNDIYKNSDVLIEYQKDYGIVYGENKKIFSYDTKEIDSEEIGKILSNYQRISFLNKAFTFKDINKDFDIRKNYEEKQIGLKAEFAVIKNEILNFDLHESKHGPHGLIGGSTGSGKSELIISLLLSLCLKYRPDYLNIIIIDYKGGGIKESLSYEKKLTPHVIASIDNLETGIFERLIIAIDYECKRRQKLFKELSVKSSNSIMNIDDYLNNDYLSFNLPSISHLLIVVDEFAELKKENPEVIRELISFSRIGRSLGIHLILATQRPSGIIDDEIWSNSRFKIALKVFDEKDSNDIIKSKKAAYLSNPGEFYLLVDDNLQQGRSIYSKKDINDNDSIEISLLDNKLDISKQKIIKKNKTIDEASYIVNKIIETTNELGINVNKMDFHMPSSLTRKELINKYSFNDGIVLGETDDYLNFKKEILYVSNKENVFICSYRNNEINTVINSLSKRTIVIGNGRYENKYISDSILYDESNDIKYLFDKLLKENDSITLLIEDIICLLAYDDTYINYIFQLLRRSSASNVNLIVLSKTSAVNIKLLNSFKNKYLVEINDKQDIINIFGTNSKYKGKSFYFDEVVKSFVPVTIEKYEKKPCFINGYVKQIPSIIKTKSNINGILIGYDKKTRKEVYIDENENLIIFSYDENILNKYQRIFAKYQNINFEVYNKTVSVDAKTSILWVGEGLYNQRLFYIDGKEDLDTTEAYYLKGNKGIVIKVVNNE